MIKKKRKTILLPLARKIAVILTFFLLCAAAIILYSTRAYNRLQKRGLNDILTVCTSLLADIEPAGQVTYDRALAFAEEAEQLLSHAFEDTELAWQPTVLLVDENQTLVYGSSLLYEIISAENVDATESITYIKGSGASASSYAIRSYPISETHYTLYVWIDIDDSIGQIYHISAHMVTAMVLLLLLVLLFLILTFRPVIQSLHRLTDFMNNIAGGNRKAARKGAQFTQGRIGIREIDEVYLAFNEMLKQTEKLNHDIFDSYTRMYEMEANNRRTEIAFLRSQINPHFLYNTLTMICGMAADGQNDKIISVTGALSQIFRYSIKGSDMVTLREEMEIVQSYLMIQKERFDDRFSVRYEFSDDSMDCLIPRMVIQPLVENAIVHGLEKSLRHGELLIGAGRNPEHGYLAIWIFDTGVGMPQSKLNELRAMVENFMNNKTGDASADLARMDSEIHDSIGILNVNSRMVLYYGTNYTLLIDSEENVGTNIQIRVPYRTKKDSEGSE